MGFASAARLSRRGRPGFSGMPAGRRIAFLTAACLCCVTLALTVAGVPAVRAATLRVRVTDARSGLPLTGAFVQVGQAPGTPFNNNWGVTGPGGIIEFSSSLLVGPQTVTAGLEGMALLTVVEAAVDSLTLALHPAVTSPVLPEPKAEILGTVSGISTQSNDGNLDVGIVYPAVRLSDFLASRTLPIEVPSDTVSFPVVGSVVLPGNVVIPTQTEYWLLTFSKPQYHFLVPDHVDYDVLVLGGRLPVTALTSTELPLNQITMREVGAERNIPVNGNLTLNLNSDLNQSISALTVEMSEAPPGSEIFATTVANLPWLTSTRSIFYDAKSGMRDSLSALQLSGLNSTGDLADATPYLAGYYGDASGLDRYQAGRIDHTPLTLPATRILDSFFLLPELTQSTDLYQWSDVSRPGITPEPTWAIASYRLDAIAPGDPSITPRTVWEAWVPASHGNLRLPILAYTAPGGLPNVAQTPEGDQILWDLWIADPSGGISTVMKDAYATLTTWSRRTVPIEYPTIEVEEVSLGTLSERGLKFRLAPNPGRTVPDILWQVPVSAGQAVSWGVWDPTGRLRASGRFAASGSAAERRALPGTDRLPAGVYWVRLTADGRFGSIPLIITR